MSATRTGLLARGEIVDIRWGDQRDRKWLRAHVSPDAWREFRDLPQWVRREMSVYRCIECGQFGAFDGIGEDTLLIWTLKGRKCSTCSGCNCADCQGKRAEAET